MVKASGDVVALDRACLASPPNIAHEDFELLLDIQREVATRVLVKG